MSFKIERALKYLLLILCLMLVKELYPAILQDEQRIFYGKVPEPEVFLEKQEIAILEELPDQYDGRKYGICPTLKEQGNTGNCWAVSATTTLEAGFLPKESLVFSQDHMSYENSFTREIDGGDYSMIMAYLAGWQGPVLERDGEEVPEVQEPVKHVQEMQVMKECSIDEIKRAVYQYGAVQASIYMDLNNAFSSSPYYNQIDHSYYYRGEAQANHDVCIIGWDDHFPAESFHVNTRKDGAFICQNSWGDKFGENGIFYVSYQDSCVRNNVIAYTVVEETDNYDHLYQTDLCGWVGVVGYGDSAAYAANVFTIEAGEKVEAVGFYATGPDTSYEIYLLDQGQPLEHVLLQVPSAKGRLPYAGYYTIPLIQKWNTTEREEVTVVIRLDTPGEQYPIATEYVADENTMDVTISDGDGYVSHNGIIWQGTESTFHCNVCMKVYTREEKNLHE